MYQEDNDDTTRVGLWITFGVVTLVVISIVGAMVVRQLRSAAAAAAPSAPAAVVVLVEEIILIEGPLVGDLVSTLYFETRAVRAAGRRRARARQGGAGHGRRTGAQAGGLRLPRHHR